MGCMCISFSLSYRTVISEKLISDMKYVYFLEPVEWQRESVKGGERRHINVFVKSCHPPLSLLLD